VCRAAQEIEDVEAEYGCEIDFGGRLKLREIQQMLPGTSSTHVHEGAEVTRAEAQDRRGEGEREESAGMSSSREESCEGPREQRRGGLEELD
jgi:hypothetical protein